MIRILHMIGSLEVGGSQMMVMNLYRNIDRNKVQFDFIVDHSERMYFAEEIRSLGGKIYIMPTFTGNNVLKVRAKWKEFFYKHKEYKILHSHVRSYASIYLPIAHKCGIKTIIHSHNISNGSGIKALIKSVLQFPLRFQADYYMACSREAGMWLFGTRTVKQKNFCIVKNAIDIQRFIFKKEKRDSIRKEFEIDENTFVLGFLGRVVQQKNPFFVVDIFSELKRSYKNCKLLFVGEGDLLDDVKEKVKILNISEDVIFTGNRSDTESLLCAMDVYIFPSLWEGLGISLVEAQASGLQCVCSENIPKEAIVTELVDVLNLSAGERYWANHIQKYSSNKTRINPQEKLMRAGYDVKVNTKKIQDFYLSL